MYNRFKIHLEQSFPEIGNSSLLIAISGGIDSVVLLDLLSKVGVELSLAHCNFKLRGKDADDDAIFTHDLARRYNVPFHVKEFDTKAYALLHNCSIQVAARELRYDWFKELMTENEYSFLLTAHHADDNLETFMINLSRGTGIDGLCGIPERSDYILRPLLVFSKEEINQYASQKDLKWREDLSNQDNKYLRNKIRKELIPIFKQISPSFLETFSSSVNNLKGTREIVGDRMQVVREKVIDKEFSSDHAVVHFKVKPLLEFSENTAYLYQLFHLYGFHQWNDIKSLLTAQSGKQVLSKTHRLVKHRDHILLSQISNQDFKDTEVSIEDHDGLIPLETSSLLLETKKEPHFRFDNCLDQGLQVALFDKDLLSFPLVVRKWKKGDYFYPIGMKGKKKLSKFFKDEKYSLLDKENIWLLCSGEDIIWIIGRRMDNRFKISDKTKTILKATLQI